MIDAFINFRVDSIMDRSRSLKRPSDGEPSGDSQRQRMEGQTSRGFGLGPAGRDHLRFTGTATIHLNLDIESLFKEIEQRQDIATQRHKAHDQASSRKPGREVRLFGVNIAGDQRMDEKSKETAFNFFKEAELNSYHEGYQKPLDERSVKEAIAVAMYEVIIDKCFKNNEQDLIQPFLREVRQLDLYKQAYGRKKSSFQQQEGSHFEEDREKLPKQKQTSPSWSHEGEQRQSL
jgi:hypothetical protein